MKHRIQSAVFWLKLAWFWFRFERPRVGSLKAARIAWKEVTAPLPF